MNHTFDLISSSLLRFAALLGFVYGMIRFFRPRQALYKKNGHLRDRLSVYRAIGSKKRESEKDRSIGTRERKPCLSRRAENEWKNPRPVQKSRAGIFAFSPLFVPLHDLHLAAVLPKQVCPSLHPPPAAGGHEPVHSRRTRFCSPGGTSVFL